MSLMRQLRRHLEAVRKLAPDACLGCGKQRNGERGWIYVAGTEPPGGVACTAECLEKWLRMMERSGGSGGSS